MSGYLLADLSDDQLRQRKDEVLRGLLGLLAAQNLIPDYPVTMLAALREAELRSGDHIAVLEALVEIESIKYTLCARRLRQIDPEEQQ